VRGSDRGREGPKPNLAEILPSDHFEFFLICCWEYGVEGGRNVKTDRRMESARTPVRLAAIWSGVFLEEVGGREKVVPRWVRPTFSLSRIPGVTDWGSIGHHHVEAPCLI